MIKDEPREIRRGPVSVTCEMLARLPPVYMAWSFPASKAPYPQAGRTEGVFVLRTHSRRGCCPRGRVRTRRGLAFLSSFVDGDTQDNPVGWSENFITFLSGVIYNLKHRVEEHLPKIRQAGNKCQG